MANLINTVMEFVLSATFPYIVLGFLGLFLVYYIVAAMLHIPRERLTDKQVEEMVKYGLIHLTDRKSAASILETGFDEKIGTPLYFSERKMIWFYAVHEDLFASINSAKEKLRKKRSFADTCILMTGIVPDESGEYRYRSDDDVIVHIGSIKKKFTVYSLQPDGSWLEDSSF